MEADFATKVPTASLVADPDFIGAEKPGWIEIRNVGLLPARNAAIRYWDYSLPGWRVLVKLGTIEGEAVKRISPDLIVTIGDDSSKSRRASEAMTLWEFLRDGCMKTVDIAWELHRCTDNANYSIPWPRMTPKNCPPGLSLPVYYQKETYQPTDISVGGPWGTGVGMGASGAAPNGEPCDEVCYEGCEGKAIVDASGATFKVNGISVSGDSINLNEHGAQNDPLTISIDGIDLKEPHPKWRKDDCSKEGVSVDEYVYFWCLFDPNGRFVASGSQVPAEIPGFQVLQMITPGQFRFWCLVDAIPSRSCPTVPDETELLLCSGYSSSPAPTGGTIQSPSGIWLNKVTPTGYSAPVFRYDNDAVSPTSCHVYNIPLSAVWQPAWNDQDWDACAEVILQGERMGEGVFWDSLEGEFQNRRAMQTQYIARTLRHDYTTTFEWQEVTLFLEDISDQWADDPRLEATGARSAIGMRVYYDHVSRDYANIHKLNEQDLDPDGVCWGAANHASIGVNYENQPTSTTIAQAPLIYDAPSDPSVPPTKDDLDTADIERGDVLAFNGTGHAVTVISAGGRNSLIWEYHGLSEKSFGAHSLAWYIEQNHETQKDVRYIQKIRLIKKCLPIPAK